ncbi:MAG: DUF4019 domain-containing protein [Chlorobium sp.]|uniref:DUF4019 domain-containing protein n=1 Tax=Chlorobium sp. TaxID=1095 RepID=UPI0025BC138D|nr:DUF4019 domain-containing protein [Chlorobium sp.]MCF8383835.1 DUF4019 domain-containing protein [Chlorobium sp.]
MKTIIVQLMTMVLVSAGFTTARGATGAEKLAASAAMDWFFLIDSGRYAESRNEASILFRGAVSEPGWVASLDGMRKPLGRALRRELAGTRQSGSLPGAPDGRYVVMTMQTAFEHKQSATETVTFMLEKDGVWRAAGYFIK